MNVVANTETIKSNINELESHKKYYLNKKSTFSNSAFGYAPKLSSYLTNLQTIYSNIASNINNLNSYLNDYVNDVEALENQSSSGSGYIKAESVNSIVSKYKNTIKNYSIEDRNLFEIHYVQQTSSSSTIKSSVNISPFFEWVTQVGDLIVTYGSNFVEKIRSTFFNKENITEKNIEKPNFTLTRDILLTESETITFAQNYCIQLEKLKERYESIKNNDNKLGIKNRLSEALEISKETNRVLEELLSYYRAMTNTNRDVIYELSRCYTNDFMDFINDVGATEGFRVLTLRQSNIAEGIIYRNEEIPLENFDEFCNILLAKDKWVYDKTMDYPWIYNSYDGLKYVSNSNYNYLINYYNDNKDKLMISMMDNGISTADWGLFSDLKIAYTFKKTDEMTNKLTEMLPDYITKKDITNYLSNVHVFNSSDFQKFLKENNLEESPQENSTPVGMTSPNNNTYQNISGSVDRSVHIILHELIHKYAYDGDGFLNIDSGLRKGIGVDLEYQTYGTSKNIGLDEATTEYIAKYINNEARSIDTMSGYDNAVDVIAKLVNLNVIDNKILFDAYFNGEIKKLENKMNTSLKGVSSFNEISSLIDQLLYGKNSEKRKEAQNKIDAIIGQITNSNS